MINQINEECMNIYKTKIDLNNSIKKILKTKTSNSELIDIKNEEGEILKELNIYVIKLMTYLWEEPKLIANIISMADKNDVRENLAPLFGNNFFENILSPNYIEDNLLYVITLLLQKEINNMNINNYKPFLNETSLSILLEELAEKKDIQKFFNLIISKAVEKLESTYSNKNIIFNLNKIEKEIQKKENFDKNDNKSFFSSKRSDIIRSSITFPASEGTNDDSEITIDLRKSTHPFEPKLLKDKYFTIFSEDEIIKEKNEYNNEKETNKSKNTINNNNIFDIYLHKISLGDKKDNENEENEDIKDGFDLYENIKRNIYDNEVFLNDLDKDEKIKSIYFDNFYKVTEIINIVFTSIKENLNFLPYSIKFICKIISVFVKKKFPNLNILEHNAFIGRFFFGKILLFFFINPTYEALITNVLISKKTLSNLKEISKIIMKLIYGELFTNDSGSIEYTPFNFFFVEKMPEVLNIFEEIQKVILPNFIEKLIEDKLPEDYKYDYFKENPDEIINHRSICFKIEDVNSIIKTIGLNEKLYFNDKTNNRLKKTYEKLCTNNSKYLIKEIMRKQMIKRNFSVRRAKPFFGSEKSKNTEDNQKGDSLLPTVYYFLSSDILVNEKYNKVFELSQKEPNIGIEEKKTKDFDNKEMAENLLIRVKNSIYRILNNSQYLEKKNFCEGTTVDTKSIFNEIKKFIQLNDYIIDEEIPIHWFLNYLLSNLNKLPHNYIENDYELLYDTIEKDLNDSDNYFNFDLINTMCEKIKYAKKQKSNYVSKKSSLRSVKLNDFANHIIEQTLIPVALYFDYGNKYLKIEKAHVNLKYLESKDDIVIEDTKKKCLICKNVKILTNEFPDLTKYQTMQDIDLFCLEKSLALPEKLQEYLNIIREHLEKTKVLTEKNTNSVMDRIYDYIIRKIYDRIFPKEYEKDDNIFKQSVFLTWIEPKHFIQDKNYYAFDGFLPDVNNFLKKLEKDKSPRKKFSYMSKIFELIRNLVKFNGGDIMTGVDDQMPILNYALIKARPVRIYSNCKFMELFLGERRNKKEDSELIQFLSLCDYICNMSHSKLLNVTKEEYILKCNEAAKEEYDKNT